MSAINHDLVEAISLTLLHSLWQGLLILFVCTLLVRSGLVTSVSGKYYLHLFSLISVAVITTVTFVLLFKIDGAAEDFRIFSPIEVMPLAVESQQHGLSWQFLLTIIWLVGMGVSLLRSLGALVRTHLQCLRAYPVKDEWREITDRLRDMLGMKKSVRILQSHDVISPFVFGIWRPVMIFPSVYFLQLTPQQLESIILHELTHIQRHDFIINLLQVIIEGLLFFNPAVWYLSQKVRQYREFRCDDEVQRRSEDKSVYLKALYKLSTIKAQQSSLAIHLFRNQSELLIRMKRMVNISPEPAKLRSLLTGSLLCVVIVAGFAISSLFSESTVPDFQKTLGNGAFDQPENDVESVDRHHQDLLLIPKTDMLVSRLNYESKIPSTSNVEESMNPTPLLTSLSVANDTIPKSPRMKELELIIEEKAAELERLSDQLEKEMEQNIEMDVEAMEELSEKLSSLHDQKIEGIESRYGAQMERLDGLSEQWEDRMKVFEKEMESLNEDLLRKLSEEMEMISIELADHDSIPDDRRKQLQQEMQDLGRQMQEEMKSVHELQEQMMNNPELRQLREDMSSLQEQLQPMHEEFRNIWTEEARALQEQLHQMQDQLNVKMSGLHNELQEQIRVKSDKIQELQEEMHQELRKLHEKQ